ncbi:MAG: hypothetical protein GX262_03955 [Clostridia bacterium]|nr:hypothetical protein [Clostridia bacterium]
MGIDLNWLYEQAERKYNRFCSNWEWFVTGPGVIMNEVAPEKAFERVYQN